MTSSTRRKTLILLGLIIFFTALIAASLPGWRLQPGMPIPGYENGQLVIPPMQSVPLVTITISQFAKTLIALLLTGITIYAIYRLMRGTNWRQLGTYLQPIMISLSIVGVIFFLISLMLFDAPKVAPMELPTPLASPIATSPLGSAPALLLWLVGIGLLVISGLLGFWIFRPASQRPATLELVGLEAEKAWEALRTGLDLRGVIVQCYRQMSLALAQEQGLERQEWMTTREFERLLAAAGVPHEPIHQLTKLFEAIRYGNWQPNPVDEQKARECLQAIVQYSQEVKNSG